MRTSRVLLREEGRRFFKDVAVHPQLVVLAISQASRHASTLSLDAIYQGLPVTVHANFRLPVEAKNGGPIRAGTPPPVLR
jgi:hypothetical protein